jgi:hypothetical protein
VTVGLMNTHYAYLPIPMVIAAPRTVDPRGKMWNRLRAAIGQPNFTKSLGLGTWDEMQANKAAAAGTLLKHS